MSFGSSKKDSGAQGMQQTGAGVTAASQMSEKEKSQYESSFQLGDLLRQIEMYRQGLGNAPSGYLSPEQQFLQQTGPLGQSYYDQTLRGVQNPYGAYESQLQPSLKLMEDYVNKSSQQRGLLQSGLNIEQMGRSGIDLAIREAQDRMNFRGQELARGGELTNYTQGVGQQNLSNMAALYGQQQEAGLRAKQTQVQGAVQAAPYYSAVPSAQLGTYYGSQGGLGAGIGGAVGAVGGGALGMMTGNPIYGLYGAGLGASAGANLGRSIF